MATFRSNIDRRVKLIDDYGPRIVEALSKSGAPVAQRARAAREVFDVSGAGDTVIGERTRIDNLVQIGHDAMVGRLCHLVAQSGIAEGVTLGDHVTLGRQAGVGENLTVGEGAYIGAGAGVVTDVKPGAKV